MYDLRFEKWMFSIQITAIIAKLMGVLPGVCWYVIFIPMWVVLSVWLFAAVLVALFILGIIKN